MFREDLAYIPKSSLAESSQAGMTAAGDKAISLVDALIADFGDSAKLYAKWENHKRGDRNLGYGPTGIHRITRRGGGGAVELATFYTRMSLYK